MYYEKQQRGDPTPGPSDYNTVRTAAQPPSAGLPSSSTAANSARTSKLRAEMEDLTGDFSFGAGAVVHRRGELRREVHT